MENICSYQKLTYNEESVPNKGYSPKQAQFLCTVFFCFFLYVSLSSSTVCQPNFFSIELHIYDYAAVYFHEIFNTLFSISCIP